MGQVNILKIKRLITTVSWHACFFSIPFHFSVFILTFSSWNTFAAHEECGITLRVQLKYEVRYQFSSWDLKGPKAHTIHASKLSKRFSSKLLGWLRRTSRATAWHDLEVVEQGGQELSLLSTSSFRWKAKWFRPCYTENQTSPVYRGQASTFTPRFHDAYPNTSVNRFTWLHTTALVHPFRDAVARPQHWLLETLPYSLQSSKPRRLEDTRQSSFLTIVHSSTEYLP